jgi:hypothetical protein
MDAPRPSRSISFDTMTEVVHATERGAGVGLIPLPLTSERLRGGSLVRLLEQSLQTDESYFLLHQRVGGARREMAEVRDWILAEARRNLSQSRERGKSLGFSSGVRDERSARREAGTAGMRRQQPLTEQAETVLGAGSSVAGA